MRVELRGVSKGKDGEALPPADAAFGSGEAVLAVAETEQRPTVLGLIASGRMVPDAGTVTIDGTGDSRSLRRRVALVDAPPVCDPEPNVTVTGLTVEELMFAGRPSTVPAARRWLAQHGFGDLARHPIGELVPRDRIELLMQLTALRPEVEGLVLVSPDRHRGEPAEWWQTANRFAAEGYAVLVVAGAAAIRVLAELPEPEDAAVAEDGAEPEPEPTTDAGSASETDAEPEPVAASEPGTETAPNPEPTPAAQPEPIAAPGPDAEPEPASTPASAPEPAPATPAAPETDEEDAR